MTTSERAALRLKNIHAIEPIISALKTLSLGSWQSALVKTDEIKQYEENFDHILSEILPRIKKIKKFGARKHGYDNRSKTIFIIIGTERGLCGNFNKSLSEKAVSWIDSKHFSNFEVWAMGSKMIQLLDRKNNNVEWDHTLKSSFLSSYASAYVLATQWLKAYEDYEFDELFLIYNQQSEEKGFRFSTYRLIPYELNEYQDLKSTSKTLWPSPIIESDPINIYKQIIIQKIASRFFLTLQQSSIAENYYRFTLLQDAEENAEEMIQDLVTIINTSRKQKITQAVQELASAAGLLDN
jgi:F-type H+-transporting ATPase subunit gamma